MPPNKKADTGSLPIIETPLKVLMLHGFTQSGPLFHSKSRALQKSLSKRFPDLTYSYPSGPHVLRPEDIPYYDPGNHTVPDSGTIESFAWWRRKDGTSLYQGIDEGLARIADTIKMEGPFDGVIGFSQGGCAAGIVAALLDAGRKRAMNSLHAKHPENIPYPESFNGEFDGQLQAPLKFVIVYSGFAAPKEYYRGFYDPKVTSTPSLHVIGSMDTVVEESRSRELAGKWEEGEATVVVHPGGHFVPSAKMWLDIVVGFVVNSVEEKKGGKEADEKEAINKEIDEKETDKKETGGNKVDDMEVPF